MDVTFRIVRHSLRQEIKVVEILLDDKVVGVIYPNLQGNGIRIVSAHFSGKDIPKDFDGEVIVDSGESSFPPIPHIKITFKPRKYIIRQGKIEYLE